MTIRRDDLEELAQRHGISRAALAELETLVHLDGSLVAKTEAAQPSERAETTAVFDGSRYAIGSRLGGGGMGEVWRATDHLLERDVALKAVRPELVQSAKHVAQFYDEARITARLQHPGIVPVHELGRFPDGRLYYTMKEVAGRTLADIARSVHRASGRGTWHPDERGWTLRRLLDAFLRVCEAVGFAHDCGIIHRDLKPDNVMVGEFGEIRVVDWGLAIASEVRGDTGPTWDDPRTSGPVGTPGYMAPEQARGEPVGPAADVYALGALLHELMTNKPVFAGSAIMRLTAAMDGREPSRPEGPGPLPEGLPEVCMRALAPLPDGRHPDAAALADDVRACLDGVRRRERALEIAASADELLVRARELRASATLRRRAGNRALEAVRANAPTAEKRAAWVEIDSAQTEDAEAALAELEYVQRLQTALYHVPELPEARDALAAFYQVSMAAAEARHDRPRAAEYEALLRMFDRGRHARWLDGQGRLSIATEPPGATVVIERFDVRERRMVPVLVGVAGESPLTRVELPRGSYRCLLRSEGRREVVYPVQIGRGHHWDGVPPNTSSPQAVYLPMDSELSDDDCYVPAGWFESGGDPEAADALRAARLWCPGFVMQRFAVTNADYIVFLDDLVARGGESDALRYAPRERSGAAGEAGALVYGRGDDGRFVLRPDVDGDSWGANWPVLLVDWDCAVAYAAWFSERTGHAWRLPAELEWEKAARGVDGRYYPWGDFLDPSWCCMRDSHDGRRVPASVHDFPLDVSPYGVRGLGGNARDWCADPYAPEGSKTVGSTVVAPDDSPARQRVERGGCFYDFPRDARSANRFGPEATARFHNVSIRLVRSLANPR